MSSAPCARWPRSFKSAVVICAFMLAVASAPPATADVDAVPTPPSPTAPCNAISPFAFPCVGTGKFADAVAAECRRVGVNDNLCLVPLAAKVTQAATVAYLQSWVHRTAQFQYALGNAVPFRDAQWIGTHNSFNSLVSQFTPSHADSNQQLSMPQQFDIDARSIELDLHYIPQIAQLGGRAVTVCHGRGPSQANLGCTTEPVLTKVLPPITDWLNANPSQVVLILIEDQLKDPTAYASALDTLERQLRRPDGSSLIYHPTPAEITANGCADFPRNISRDEVRTAGAQVVLVSDCVPSWGTTVFNWEGQEVQSGSTFGYQAYPKCDATYGPAVYATNIVRYFEDSTFISALINPTRPPNNPAALTPTKAQSMTNCGVNLFGFDQLLPEDGRIQGTLWSWAPDEPRASVGTCTLQRADSRWAAAPCGATHPAGCQSASGTWTVTAPVTFANAPAACAAVGLTFGLPRTGVQNSRLHAVAGPAGGAWVNYTIT
ncbi:PI-PLC domain-containing protein [Mycobacterium sp. ML4]